MKKTSFLLILSIFSLFIVCACQAPTVVLPDDKTSSETEPTIDNSINEIDVDDVVFENYDCEYDGLEHVLKVKNAPETVMISYENNTLKNVGTIEAIATLTAPEGFVLVANGDKKSSIQLKANLTINPKEISFSIMDLYETGEPLVPVIDITGVLEGEEIDYSIDYSTSEIIDAGNYAANITINSSNYKVASNVITFNVLSPTKLETPNFVYNDGYVLISLTDEASDTWAYSLDGIEWIETNEHKAKIDGFGSLTVYVKAISESAGYLDSEVVSKQVYAKGTVLEYDFKTVSDGLALDLTGQGADLMINNATVTSDGLIIDNKEASGSVAYSPEALNYDNAVSLTVELSARLDELAVPTSGDKWYPLVYKTNEYFIGYWTVASEPSKARLCMVLFSGEEGDRYYDAMWFDDTNFWLPLDCIADGNYHQYAITYDDKTGVVKYYMDYILIGSANRTAGEVCRYTGNSIVFGGWGNKYDIDNNLMNIYSSASYNYFKVRNYCAELNEFTDFSLQTNHVIVSDSDLNFKPSNNVTNLTYLNNATDVMQYGSMTFSISFILNANDMVNGVRYTVANRGDNFQLYLIKDNGHVYGQCYIKTTEPSNIYGQTFLDFGAIDEYVSTFGDGVTVNTMKVTFDAITGRAKGQVNDVYIDWCYKEFGGTLINPSYTHNIVIPLYIGSAAWGEALPSSTEIKSFTLNSAPIDISLTKGYIESLKNLVEKNKEVDMSDKMLLIGASHFTLWYDDAAKDLAPEFNAINFGVGGSNADFWVQNCYLLEELKNDPEYILLTIGGNIVEEDAAKNTELMQSVVEKLSEMFPTSKIVFISIFDQPYRANSSWYTEYKDTSFTAIKKWIEENNIENDFILDLRYFVYDNAATTGEYYKEGYGYLRTDIWLDDNVHLNNVGLDLFAQAIKTELLK